MLTSGLHGVGLWSSIGSVRIGLDLKGGKSGGGLGLLMAGTFRLKVNDEKGEAAAIAQIH